MSIKAGLYARVSTEEQRDRQSILTQQNEASRYAEREGINFVDSYLDDGVSGSIPMAKRPEGGRLLQDIAAGKIDTVYVYAVDRLGRDNFDILSTRKAIESLGADLVSMTQQFDRTAAGDFMFNQHASIAEYSRATYVERSVQRMRQLAEDGTWPGGVVPYGYTVEGTKRDARLVIDPESAEVVKMIYSMAADEKLSCRVISDRLNAQGIPTSYAKEHARGKRQKQTRGIWRSSRVLGILRSTTYKGVHTYGKRIYANKEEGPKTKFRVGLIERRVPAIVDELTWERAQQTLDSNFRFGKRNAKHPYLMRGLMKCGICGLTYIGSASQVKSGLKRYYVCNGKHQYAKIWGDANKKCPSASVHADWVEGEIWREVEGFLRDPGPVLEELAAQMSVDEGEREGTLFQLKRVEKELSLSGEARGRAITLATKGLITEQDLAAQLAQISQQEEGLRAEVARLEAKLEHTDQNREALTTAEALLQELHTRLDDGLSFETKRRVLEILIQSVTVKTTDERVEVHVEYRVGDPVEHCTGMRAVVNLAISRQYAVGC